LRWICLSPRLKVRPRRVFLGTAPVRKRPLAQERGLFGLEPILEDRHEGILSVNEDRCALDCRLEPAQRGLGRKK
jgi:hypothetical protein